MDPLFEQKYHRFEQDYWWFRARRECILRLMTRSLRIPATARILEIGCSGGLLLTALRQTGYSNLAGIDISPDAIALCKQAGLEDVHIMDAANPTLPPHSFDFLIASDVLEHLADPAAALLHWLRLLKPGGKLLVFVPAYQFLWSGHDLVNHHQRRYTAGLLRRQLQQAGFSVTRTGYWNTLLFPPIALIRLAMRLLQRTSIPKDQIFPIRPLINRIILTLLGLENALISAGIRFPFGVSTFALASAPSI